MPLQYYNLTHDILNSRDTCIIAQSKMDIADCVHVMLLRKSWLYKIMGFVKITNMRDWKLNTS